MNEFTTGQHLLAFPEVKRYVLTNLFSDEQHLVT
ncbi:protein GP45.2, partial [Xanthomonas campestris]